MKELDFYNKTKNWNFDEINYISESLTNWDLYDELKKYANENSVILDLGTGGGEKVLKNFPDCKEVIATDYSPEMIKTANKNLAKSGRKNINFKVMDNLKMDTPENYFDIVVARHTCTDAKQIYKTLKSGGKLLIRGVDKVDCWNLKFIFKEGTGFNDEKPISLYDYEQVLNAGYKNVELIPLHVREYYKTKEDFIKFLLKVPILNKFNKNEKFDFGLLDKYIEENTTPKGILLIRRYYGIIAEK